VLRFVQLLAQLRRRHVEFRRETFLKGATSRATVKDVTWLNVGGAEMKQGEWQDGNLRTLGIWFGKRGNLEGRLLLLLNAGETGVVFQLPAVSGNGPWIRHFDTAIDNIEAASLGLARDYRLEASSAALLEC
jgi:glycogen operon protein